MPTAGGASHIIITSGDRFTNAHEINDLFEAESPAGQLYVRLKELGIQVEREWWIDEEGTDYIVDLALPVEDGWLRVTFGDRPGPAGGLHFATEAKPEACLREVVQAGHLGPKAGKGFLRVLSAWGMSRWVNEYSSILFAP